MDLTALLHDFCDTRLCHPCGDGVLSVLQVLLKSSEGNFSGQGHPVDVSVC